MLFITNRTLDQPPRSRRGRSVSFNLENASASQSLFFCRRTGSGEYTEVLSAPFFEELKEDGKANLVFYIHGFNNLPEDVFDRVENQIVGQIGDDVTVLPIIWPCRKGSDDDILSEYYDDQLAADATSLAIARVLGKFWSWQQEQEDGCKKRINVLAHSMGNRILRGALHYWSRNILHHAPPYLFRNCFMAAADIANEALDEGREGEVISFASRNVVVYYSADDLALRASKIANAAQISRRLGHTGPYDLENTPPNVVAFDCSDIPSPTDDLGHSYFLDERVMKHISSAISSGRINGLSDGERSGILVAE